MSSDGPKRIFRGVKRWRSNLRRLFTRPDIRKPDGRLAMGQVLQARETNALPSRKQLSYFPKLLSASERRLAAVALLIFLIAGGLLLLRLLNSQQIQIASAGGEYTEGVIGSPQLINPIYALTNDVDADLVRLIYSGLMRYDTKEGLVLDLAESMEISEDATEYTFTIREDAKWHDGRPVVANDVLFTMVMIQNNEYLSPLEVSFSNVRVEQVDERTVRFILDEAFSPFLSVLTVGILPAHIWQNIPASNAQLTELNKKPVGSGPYEFEKFVKDSRGIRSYTLKRNTQYYGDVPFIETLNFKFYGNINEAVDALRNKNIEGIAYLPPEQVESFEKDNDIQIFFPSLAQYTAAFLNQDSSVIADDAVRVALAHATNKQGIIDEAISGHGTAIDSFLLPGMVGDHPTIATRAFNLEAAATALEEGDWTFEEGASVRSKDGTELAITITTLSSTELTATAEILAEQWRQVGATVSVRPVSNTDFQNDVLKNRNYDVLLSGELYGFDPDPYAFWHSSQADYPGLNLSGFSNRNADDLIETGRSSSDTAERSKAYQDLQDLVAEEAAAIFLYQPSYPYAIAKKIKGNTIGNIVLPSDRFSEINEWYIKTRKIFGSEEAPEVTVEVPEPAIEIIEAPEEDLEMEEETDEEVSDESDESTSEDDDTVDNT